MPTASQPLLLAELMEASGVKFGTSGARGLAASMTDRVCYAYTKAFLQYLRQHGKVQPGCPVGIARDLRPSSERIAEACARAVLDLGHRPVNCGKLPTPALANYGFRKGIATLMVTGSHIPDDRNGIKFNTPTGEILKPDEDGIRAQRVEVPSRLFDAAGGALWGQTRALPAVDPAAAEAYCRRYLEFLPSGCLAGLRVGLYEHSTVARQTMYRVLTGLGAQITRLGFSPRFVPVDTEAIREEDIRLAREWAGSGEFDCLLSADGDGDRPLVSDERGEWLRGDVAGVLCARYLAADAVVTPVSSNTMVEKCRWFRQVIRTRIGSPYVIAGMERARQQGFSRVVGYEANGGFLLATDLEQGDRRLPALATRDALIVGLSILLMAKQAGTGIAQLVCQLPRRYTASDRLKDFPAELSRAKMDELSRSGSRGDHDSITDIFGPHFGKVASLDRTDGLRITFSSGEIAHLRPSGNAPELRAYAEASTPERAHEMTRICMEILARWRDR
jgi:phosphomannomutase